MMFFCQSFYVSVWLLSARIVTQFGFEHSQKPVYVYSCSEKGCLTKGEKLTRQCRKLLWVMVVFTVIEPQDVSTW